MTTAFDLNDRAELLTRLARAERDIARLHAEQLRVLAMLQVLPDDPKQYVREEVASDAAVV